MKTTMVKTEPTTKRRPSYGKTTSCTCHSSKMTSRTLTLRTLRGTLVSEDRHNEPPTRLKGSSNYAV